ncbi:hypothetical protein N0V90_012597 [Kalmusia sp. IMI 367209]|nr:hypothetical protein N0V90_012597 [Kalmusia sp. IMI 367209]
MSLNITTRLTVRSAPRHVRAGTPTCTRRTFLGSLFSGPSSVKSARKSPEHTNPAPPRPTREYHPTPAQQEKLVHSPANAGQLDAYPVKTIAVSIDDSPRTFDTVFLRDSCTCPRCVDPDSKQKLFQTSDIPQEIEGKSRIVEDAEKGWMLEVEWQNDHRTRHSLDWLRRALNTEVELRGGVRYDDRVLWDRETIVKNNKWIDYKDWMGEDEVLFDALSHLNKYGLLFLKNVPESEESVVDIAGRIGTLKDTFYGRTWDVRSKPKAENIAYTPQFLGLHMDLLYTSNPPHLQLLHSLRARTPGGESFFSDAFHAAQKLHQMSKTDFRTLLSPRTLPSTASTGLHPSKALLRLVLAEKAKPRFGNYLAASHAYEKLLSTEENLFEYRLNEGECVIFDNRRVLHARKAFDATKGERWLKGAYVDDDVFFSKLRVLEERFTGKWVADGVVRPIVR